MIEMLSHQDGQMGTACQRKQRSDMEICVRLIQTLEMRQMSQGLQIQWLVCLQVSEIRMDETGQEVRAEKSDIEVPRERAQTQYLRDERDLV